MIQFHSTGDLKYVTDSWKSGLVNCTSKAPWVLIRKETVETYLTLTCLSKVCIIAARLAPIGDRWALTCVVMVVCVMGVSMYPNVGGMRGVTHQTMTSSTGYDRLVVVAAARQQ